MLSENGGDQYNQLNISNYKVSPSLSTIDQPGFEMGKKALKLLLKEIKAKKNHEIFEPQTVVLPTDLIVRNSTKNT